MSHDRGKRRSGSSAVCSVALQSDVESSFSSSGCEGDFHVSQAGGAENGAEASECRGGRVTDEPEPISVHVRPTKHVWERWRGFLCPGMTGPSGGDRLGSNKWLVPHPDRYAANVSEAVIAWRKQPSLDVGQAVGGPSYSMLAVRVPRIPGVNHAAPGLAFSESQKHVVCQPTVDPGNG